jgi:hypothetical protein
MAAVDQAFHHIRAHTAEADHSNFHWQTISEIPRIKN